MLDDIARDLVKSLRRDVTTDWLSRDDIWAKHGYQPDAQPTAT